MGQCEVADPIGLVQTVQVGAEPLRGLQPVPAAEETGGRAEGAGEGAAATGLHPEELLPGLRHGIVVVGRWRKRVQVGDQRRIGAPVNTLSTAVGDAEQPGELPGMQ